MNNGQPWTGPAVEGTSGTQHLNGTGPSTMVTMPSGPDDWAPLGLRPEHVATLVKSAVAADVAAGLVQSYADRLRFTYRHPDGSAHYVDRLDSPPPKRNGKGPDDLLRYVGETDRRGLQVHPWHQNLIRDASVPLVVVEGTKQHHAVVTVLRGQRAAVVGLNGINGWQWKPAGKETGTSAALPDWGHIPLRGRALYSVPDGDAATNENVRRGAEKFEDWARVQGAEVCRVAVPLLPGQDKTGVDDYLAAAPAPERAAVLARMIQEARDGNEALFVDVTELDDLPPLDPMIEGVLNRETVVWLSGKFGTYKTFLALSWALSVAVGRPWAGREVPKALPVAYVAAEGHRGLSKRVRAWCDGVNGGELPARGMFQVTKAGLDPRRPDKLAALKRAIRKQGAQLVVFDTLHRCAPGFEENSNTEAGEIFGALQQLRDDLGCTVLVLHHTGHEGKRARGASSMEDDADDAFVIQLAGDGEDRSAAQARTLEHRKSKEGESGEKYRLDFHLIGGSAYVDTVGAQAPTAPVFEPSGAAAKAAGLVRFLDGHQVPESASRPQSQAALSAAGVEYKAGNEVWADAVKIRKGRKARGECGVCNTNGSCGMHPWAPGL